ncbi:hypothetical protein [Actibacterium sp. 188UL27-1]|uniref:hypothetical protein n=1 Tax=Actibacterium sp. 188UL27-1 TaxID=2786961 RepID=UPI00195B33D0|nr:hypothetical protein [Actibacterium sp. 188UL27-1]MBM7069676.1 hypothetical protein [Actibacterium sp. 188UL27-1]
MYVCSNGWPSWRGVSVDPKAGLKISGDTPPRHENDKLSRDLYAMAAYHKHPIDGGFRYAQHCVPRHASVLHALVGLFFLGVTVLFGKAVWHALDIDSWRQLRHAFDGGAELLFLVGLIPFFFAQEYLRSAFFRSRRALVVFPDQRRLGVERWRRGEVKRTDLFDFDDITLIKITNDDPDSRILYQPGNGPCFFFMKTIAIRVRSKGSIKFTYPNAFAREVVAELRELVFLERQSQPRGMRGLMTRLFH